MGLVTWLMMLIGCSSAPDCPSRAELGLLTAGDRITGTPAFATVVGERTPALTSSRKMAVELVALGAGDVPAKAILATSPRDPAGRIASTVGADAALAAKGATHLVYLDEEGRANAVYPVADRAEAEALDQRIRAAGCDLWTAAR